MTLDQLIRRFETSEVTDADFEHPLARDIVEELAQCRESEVQRVLFGDARQLADHIIERYLRLDREDKLKMAEAYRDEECFRKVGAIKSATQIRITKYLGESNFELLSWISNYSKFIPILERYIQFAEANDAKLSAQNSSLTFYLSTHNTSGEEVNPRNSESLNAFYTYDFRNCRQKSKYNNASLIASMTFGVPDDLKRRVIDAQSLLALRMRILKNYVQYVEENEAKLSLINLTLVYYLMRHNSKGEEVKLQSYGSLNPFCSHDFRKDRRLRSDRKFRKDERNAKSLLDSLAFGVPDDLKQRVIDAQSLLRLRTRILENYVRYIEENEAKLNAKNSKLTHYLLTHNANEEEVKLRGSASLDAFYRHDFRNDRTFRKDERNAKSLLDSLAFGVPDDLKQRVIDARSLLRLRTRILKNYVQYIEENKTDLSAKNQKLPKYLLMHNSSGKKSNRSGSLVIFYYYDFRNGRQFKKGELNPESLFASMTYRITDAELVEKVRKYALAA